MEVSHRDKVVLLFDQKSEFQHEFLAADRERTIPDFIVALREIFAKNCRNIGRFDSYDKPRASKKLSDIGLL